MATRKGHWGNCQRSCPIACLTAGKSGDGSNHLCVFPFYYRGKKYDRCATVESEVPWCATAVDKNKTQIPGRWGKCSHACDVRQKAAAQRVGNIVLVAVLVLVLVTAVLCGIVLYMWRQINNYKKIADLGDGIPKSEMRVYGQ